MYTSLYWTLPRSVYSVKTRQQESKSRSLYRLCNVISGLPFNVLRRKASRSARLGCILGLPLFS